MRGRVCAFGLVNKNSDDLACAKTIFGKGDTQVTVVYDKVSHTTEVSDIPSDILAGFLPMHSTCNGGKSVAQVETWVLPMSGGLKLK